MSEQGMRDPWDYRFGYGNEEHPIYEAESAGSGRALLLNDWLQMPRYMQTFLLLKTVNTPHVTWGLFSDCPGTWRGEIRGMVMAGAYTDTIPIEAQRLRVDWLNGTPPPNAYVGTTVTTQPQADERIPDLLAIPARVRVLRVSPREPLDLTLGGIGWVVCEGGEEPMHPEWVRSLRDQCEEAGVPFWFSGWGEHVPELPTWRSEWGKWRTDYASQAGRLLDGRTWNGVPS